jgi:ethanolamine utilization cobalamin adenosyltransferase
LKLISEKVLREAFKSGVPKAYRLPEDAILSPAAKEYLNQLRVPLLPKDAADNCSSAAETPGKPEYMTNLDAGHLVEKSHPRIVFRGKIDSLQAQILFVQAELVKAKAHSKMISDLEEFLSLARQMIKSEVLNTPLPDVTLLGLDATGLREHSHHSEKYYKVKNMVPASYKMGSEYVLLNLLRTQVREAELAAVGAFTEGSAVTHTDIITALNRMSSALHIMMCMLLAGKY